MLTISGSGQSSQRISRRAWLQLGTLCGGALGLADLLRLRSAASDGQANTGQSHSGLSDRRDTAVIHVFQGGGPSHLDTFDMKPHAAAEIRGEFNPIATNLPGLQICELLPNLA